MPTVAEILAGIDSFVTPAKRRVVDMLMNPRAAMAQTVGRLSDDSNAALRDLNTQADANMLRAQGSVMADLPQYRQAEDASRQRIVNMLMNFAPVGATVWHGSPHKFDKFDSSKIGTGEGKQQQGIGSYLAESQQVAQKYADKESWKRGMDSGYLYKVDLPDEVIAAMANYELPISKQPPNVKKIIKESLDDGAKKTLNDYHGWSNYEDAPFAAVMDALEISKGNNRAATSDFLRKQGIPGIKYLDGGSRTNGGGTSNYVVFPGNEGLLNILERNGKPIK